MKFNNFVKWVNVYDIFGICWGRGPYPQLEMYPAEPEPKMKISKPPKKWSVSSRDYTPWLPHFDEENELPPCTWGTPLIEYLNSDEVKSALHIPDDIQAWDLCT